MSRATSSFAAKKAPARKGFGGPPTGARPAPLGLPQGSLFEAPVPEAESALAPEPSTVGDLPFAPPPTAAPVPLSFEVAPEPAPAVIDGPLSLLQQALLELGQGNADAARDVLQRQLSVDDSDYRAMFFLAYTLRLLGDKFLSQQFFTIGSKVAEQAGDERFAQMYRAELG